MQCTDKVSERGKTEQHHHSRHLCVWVGIYSSIIYTAILKLIFLKWIALGGDLQSRLYWYLIIVLQVNRFALTVNASRNNMDLNVVVQKLIILLPCIAKIQG
jgi:hypothetical protein